LQRESTNNLELANKRLKKKESETSNILYCDEVLDLEKIEKVK